MGTVQLLENTPPHLGAGQALKAETLQPSEATIEDMAEWVQRAYGKGEIDRAGRALIPFWTKGETPDDFGHLVDVVQNWRMSHAMPLLTFRMGLTKRAMRVDPDALVAQRLKRLSSVLDKLAREPRMSLSQMHDLGGCRAILPSVRSVDLLYARYGKTQDLFDSEGSVKDYDYIREPKPDGYRGIHVVGRYKARLSKNEQWNGHRIEIQLRSQLQHAFATAVETVTTFTRSPLKFGGGPHDWKRFFSLMGSALALREGTALVPGTPHDKNELTRELRDLEKALRVRPRLRGWADALRKLPRTNIKRFGWLLLVLDVKAQTISVTGVPNAKKAAEAIAEIEKRKDLDAVLVWVKDARDLKAAYPNYYADTGAFLKALTEALHNG